MATRATDISNRERLRDEWMQRAGQAFERMFDADHQKDLVTFTQREDRVMDLSGELAQWLLEEHISADPATLPSRQAGPEQPGCCCCPKCGRRCIAVTKEADPLPARTVTSRAGEVGLEREQFECTTCRVVFFPLGPEVGPDR